MMKKYLYYIIYLRDITGILIGLKSACNCKYTCKAGQRLNNFYKINGWTIVRYFSKYKLELHLVLPKHGGWLRFPDSCNLPRRYNNSEFYIIEIIFALKPLKIKPFVVWYIVWNHRIQSCTVFSPAKHWWSNIDIWKSNAFKYYKWHLDCYISTCLQDNLELNFDSPVLRLVNSSSQFLQCNSLVNLNYPIILKIK